MSTIIATTLSNGSVSVPTATVVNGSAKAWANLNGTGTIALRDSFNMSSVTDNGTGVYTFNFLSAFAAANYAALFCSNSVSGTGNSVANSQASGGYLVGSLQAIVTVGGTGIVGDVELLQVSAHGDLA